MKQKMIKIIHGSSNFKISFSLVDDAYNTFPMHLILIILLITIACLQEEWNLISIMATFLVAVDCSLISYRLGYQDMKRSIERKGAANANNYYRS